MWIKQCYIPVGNSTFESLKTKCCYFVYWIQKFVFTIKKKSPQRLEIGCRIYVRVV